MTTGGTEADWAVTARANARLADAVREFERAVSDPDVALASGEWDQVRLTVDEALAQSSGR